MLILSFKRIYVQLNSLIFQYNIYNQIFIEDEKLRRNSDRDLLREKFSLFEMKLL